MGRASCKTLAATNSGDSGHRVLKYLFFAAFGIQHLRGSHRQEERNGSRNLLATSIWKQCRAVRVLPPVQGASAAGRAMLCSGCWCLVLGCLVLPGTCGRSDRGFFRYKLIFRLMVWGCSLQSVMHSFWVHLREKKKSDFESWTHEYVSGCILGVYVYSCSDVP